MNNAGQVLLRDPVTVSQRTYLFTPGSANGLVEIGKPDGAGTLGVALNEAGQVAGVTNDINPTAAFLYEKGRVTRLAIPGNVSFGSVYINDRGQALVAATDANNIQRGVIANPDGSSKVLTQWLRGSFKDVASVDFRQGALNDLDQIAIGATLVDGQHTVFVLTPIPEPSTYALMLAGLSALAWIARCKHERSIPGEQMGSPLLSPKGSRRRPR